MYMYKLLLNMLDSVNFADQRLCFKYFYYF